MTQFSLFKYDLPELTSPKLWLAGKIVWIALLIRSMELPFNRSSGDQRSRSGGMNLECKKDLSQISIRRSKSRLDTVKKRLEMDGIQLPIGRLLEPRSSDLVKRYLNEAGLMHHCGMEFLKNEKLMLIPSNNNEPDDGYDPDQKPVMMASPDNPLNPMKDLPG